MQKLIYENGVYYTPYYRPLTNYTKISKDDFNACFDFAYDMSFGGVGAHKSDGRSLIKIFSNVLRGKLAEVHFYNEFRLNNNLPIEQVNFEKNPLGIWDEYDFKINNKLIDIKTIKSYTNLLLLDKEQILSSYLGHNGVTIKDYYVVTKVTPDIDFFLMQNVGEEIVNISKEKLKSLLDNFTFSCSIIGWIDRHNIETAIDEKQFVPKGAKINNIDHKPLKKDFLYVFQHDFKPVSELYNQLNKAQEKSIKR